MPTEKDLRRVFYRSIEKEGRTTELTPKIRSDIAEVTKLLAATMDDIGLTIAPVTALTEVKDDTA